MKKCNLNKPALCRLKGGQHQTMKTDFTLHVYSKDTVTNLSAFLKLFAVLHLFILNSLNIVFDWATHATTHLLVLDSLVSLEDIAGGGEAAKGRSPDCLVW